MAQIASIGTLLCCISVSLSEVITITNGTELNSHLCQTLLPNNTMLHLQPGSDIVLNFNLFCNLSNLYNITLTSAEPMNIICKSNSTRVGFGFVSITNLTIENIIRNIYLFRESNIGSGLLVYHYDVSNTSTSDMHMNICVRA